MSNYKRIFMDGYSYFITVVTHGRNPILIKNIALLRENFHVSKQQYDYTIDAIVILPDHFHMIITPKYANDYSQIVRTIKQHFLSIVQQKIMHISTSLGVERRKDIRLYGKRDFMNIPFGMKKI